MAYENSAGLGVNNQYGPRTTGGSFGKIDDDIIQYLSIDFTAESLASSFIPPVYVPKGAHFLRYILRIDEAFVVTGTAPALVFGGTAPGTDGISLSEAELEAIGTKVPASTGTGTWSTTSATGPLTAQKVTKTLTGTTPVITLGQGKGTLIAEYMFKTKV